MDKVLIDGARLVERFLDRFTGDFVKDHAPHWHLWLEHFVQMPTDAFAFAVFVGRQN